MTPLHIFCVAFLFCSNQVHCIPVISPCQPEIITSPPVVATTIVDNSVANALANALQLLIVSNLIENTIIPSPVPCCNPLPTTCAPMYDTIPIQPAMYSPVIDVVPEYVTSLPYNIISPWDNVIAPCDCFIRPCEHIITPCEPVLDIIPNIVYSELLPNVGYHCGCDILIPDCGCNTLPNCGCGINNFGYTVYGCDQCMPVVPEYVYPASVSYEYGYGNPGFPLTVEPWCHESCHMPCCNSYYY